MSFANNTPASKLCLLDTLASKRPGDKVRFLACVTSYDAATGMLTLAQPMTGTPTAVKALVSLNAILDRITAEHLATSAWINVIGRIENSTAAVQPESQSRDATQYVRVQALLVWTTGPMDFRAYEKEVRAFEGEGDGEGAEMPDATST